MIVDNFNGIEQFLKYDDDALAYYVEILIRAKDGNDCKRKHNNGDRTIKELLLHHPWELREKELEIKTLCHDFNARCYFRLNRRSFRSIGFKFIQEFLAAEQGRYQHRNPFRSISSCCGRACDEPKSTKSWMIDVDDAALNSEKISDIERYFSISDYNSSFPKNEMIIAKFPSISGIHVIVHPFDKREFEKKFPDCLVKKDSPVILYADVEKKQRA